MRWNDNRLLIFGISAFALFLVYVNMTADTAFEKLFGGLLCLGYLLVVLIVAEVARAELLPEGMTLKEAGYGDKKYRFLEEAEGDSSV